MSDIYNKNIPFLATTAIEDFWDTSQHIIFLGGWCKRYSRKIFWQDIASETMPSYFEDEKSHEAYCYLNILYERLLSVLSGQMNKIHGTNFSVRYWRIILGSWLISYIHVMYDRYKNLEHFLKLYPDFTSICLDKECFIIPKDTIHFACHVRNDDYNLQLYSSMLSVLGYKFPTKKLSVSLPDVGMYFLGKKESIKNILKYLYEIINRIFYNGEQVFLRNTYFSYLSLIKLFFKTKGAIRPCIYGYQNLPDFPVDYKARSILTKCNFGENEFEKALISLIPFDMPKNMVEGFSLLREKVKNEFIAEPKVIMSSISWWFDNTFQVWAAESAEKGAMLLGVQHGGNYGIAKDLFQEDIELNIVDKFYSWGWKRSDSYAKVIPMPAPKLVELKKKSSKKSNEVLYVLASYPRYLCQFPWSTGYWENYFFNQTLFISHLSELIMSGLRVRPYREDSGWDVKDRIKELFPKIRIEGWDIPFSASLSNCSVYICDHPLQSTTFIESLVNNKPTVLFYNPAFAANKFRDEAADLFSQLKSNSIIFDDPISAAEHLNSVYGSIDIWWNEPKRQEAVRNFLYRFGRTSPTWLQDWSQEISNVVKTRNLQTGVERKR